MSRIKKATYVDEEEIPNPIRQRVDWERIFSDIPEGKARIIGSDEAHYTTVNQALKRFQEMGKFENYYLKTRKIGNARASYVVNPRKK
jgi:hypothetical protein